MRSNYSRVEAVFSKRPWIVLVSKAKRSSFLLSSSSKMMMQSKAPLYFPYHLHKRAFLPSELTTTGRAFMDPTPQKETISPTKPSTLPPPGLTITERINMPQEPYRSTTKECFKNLGPESYSKGSRVPPAHLSVFGSHLKFPSNFKSDEFVTNNRIMFSIEHQQNNKPPPNDNNNNNNNNRMRYHPTSCIIGTKTARPPSPPPLPLPPPNNSQTNGEGTQYLESYVHHPITEEERKINKEIGAKLNKDNVKRGIEAHKDSDFITTMEDTYQYTGRPERGQLSRLTLNEKNGVTSIPFGDRNKELNMTSEQMKSYCVHVPNDGEEGGEGSSSKGYDKRVAHDKTYKSSIKMMKDNKGKTYHEKINEYPIYNSSAERQTPVQYERNFSSLPSGDLCPERVKERMTFLTSSVFSKPPPNSFATYENKSRLRTHSNVHLGSSSVFGFPLTTSLESYKGDRGELYRAHAPTTDNIAFQYKPDKPLVSTVKDSYDVKKVTQRTLNKKHLKKSHWKLPKTEVSFATTNQTHFLPPPPSFQPPAPVYPSKT